jgi:hypothetical protein
MSAQTSIEAHKNQSTLNTVAGRLNTVAGRIDPTRGLIILLARLQFDQIRPRHGNVVSVTEARK